MKKVGSGSRSRCIPMHPSTDTIEFYSNGLSRKSKALPSISGPWRRRDAFKLSNLNWNLSALAFRDNVTTAAQIYRLDIIDGIIYKQFIDRTRRTFVIYWKFTPKRPEETRWNSIYIVWPMCRAIFMVVFKIVSWFILHRNNNGTG